MDISYLLMLQDFRNATGGFLNNFLTFITTVAVDYYIAVPALVIFWAVDKRKGGQVCLTWGSSLCLNAILKAIFCVYRPWIKSNEIKPLDAALPGATGYSFPSGHSSSASGFYGALIVIYRKYKAVCIFSVVMILLTMFSRNYVGVHTPQDVVVGASIGLISAVLINRLMNWVDSDSKRDWIVLIGATIIVIATLCYVEFKQYPMDYVDGKLLVDPKVMRLNSFKDPGTFYGIVVGWFIEHRFIKFDISGSKYQKVTRCFVGALLYIFVCLALLEPLANAINIGVCYFLIRALEIALFMTVYPMIFKKIESKVLNPNVDAR